MHVLDTSVKKIKNYFKNLFTKKGIKAFLIGSSTSRKMFRIYFLILIIFSVLLYLPISLEPYLTEGWGGTQFELRYVNNCYQMKIHDFNGTEWVSSKVFTFNFFDCLFTAFSAFSDTGLSLAPTYQVFSTFGKVILILLIQIGGFGIMFFLFIIWRTFNKRMDKVTIGQILLAQSEKGNTKIGDTQKMLISSSIFIIILEVLFGLFFSLWFLFVPAYYQYDPDILTPGSDQYKFVIDSNVHNHLYHNAGNAFLAGFFHSVSAINNAGFDIISNSSLAPYRNGVHVIFLVMTSTLFVIGGIGFPVVYDVMQKINIYKHDWFMIGKFQVKYITFKRNKRHSISLLTKLVLSTYLIVMVLSICLSFIFETTVVGGGANYLWNDNTGAFGPINNPTLTYFNKSANIIFQSITTRSAGFATFNNGSLNPTTKWFNIFLMYIGGAPSSTAGGIRVTTLAIVCLVIWARITGKNNIHVFKKSISTKNIINASVVSFVGLVILSIGGVLVVTDLVKGNDKTDSFTNALFISSSAFGTTGLSTVDLAELNWYSKLYLMILMFIGQFGISSTLLVFRRNKILTNSFSYIYEDVKLG